MLVLVLLCVASVAAREATKEEIVGGIETPPGIYNHTVAMVYSSGSIRCGGTLIRNNAVLTAAHCTIDTSPSSFSFKVNSLSLSANGGSVQTIGVSSCIEHPDYDDPNQPGFVNNDIAICFLTQSVTANHDIDYARPGEVSDGDVCDITGWGRTAGGQPTSDVMRLASGSILSTTACKARGFWSSVTDLNICIDDANSGACNGDSGGPMTCHVQRGDMSIPVVAGITSFGAQNCPTSYPSVYTRVSKYTAWIQSTLESNP